MGLAERTHDRDNLQLDEKNAAVRVAVRAVNELAEGVLGFELIPADGATLPAFTAGSHIDVHLPGGLIRQYSLCNSPRERHRYVIAVLREDQGRGGSLLMHREVVAGAQLTISRPRNHFSLAEGAEEHLFIAGGIGITPIMAMIDEAQARGEPFQLFYCTRSPGRTAFLGQLQPLIEGRKAAVHHDGGDPERGLDFKQLLQKRRPGCHLYYCGPPGFMDAVEGASRHWPREAVHFERFGSPPAPAAAAVADQVAFEVRLARSGATFVVGPNETIVEVLTRKGIPVDVSCQEGYCGTCMTRYLEGEPQHHDTVLDEEDRASYVMICCTRTRGGPLVLDL